MAIVFNPFTGGFVVVPNSTFPGTLVIASGKTATINNTLTFAGTDSTTMTFPTTSATLARTDTANAFALVTTTATSGTVAGQTYSGAANPSSTSTLVYTPFVLTPTINYSAGTPGAGSYEALKIAATETALPTGTNYLIRASAGAAGTTDKFAVKNTGQVLVNGSSSGAAAPSLATLSDATTGFWGWNSSFAWVFSRIGSNEMVFTSDLILRSTRAYSWAAGDPTGTSQDLFLLRDAPGVLALRNFTTAQTFNIGNTITTVLTAGEWAKFTWASNVFRFGAVAGSSSGTNRAASWDYGDKLASATAAITVPATSGNVVFGGGVQLSNAAVTGLVAGAVAALTTATIVLYDSTGQAYRVPCVI